MKAQQRHQLKRNDFAATVDQVTKFATTHRDRLVAVGTSVLVVVVVVGGYFLWQKRTNDSANALFGVAMSITEAPIAPAPTLPGVAQTAGTYPTDSARSEAALTAFQQVEAAYPRSMAGIAARYQAAATLLSLNRDQDAEKEFSGLLADAPSSFYAPLAHLGLAETYAAEGQYDKAIQAYNDLAASRDSSLPTDGILMQLARTCERAGRAQDARVAYKRVMDEFPESVYATAAKQALAQLG